MLPLVHVIIVTHNSAQELTLCLRSLEAQDHLANSITIVDSGSDDTSYLESIDTRVTTVIKTENIGFAKANNIGFQSLRPGPADIIVFLNPDTFLHKRTLATMLEVYTRDNNIGCLTGKLLGYDLAAEKSTGLLDSTGIFRKWYGRWYDRGQGEDDHGLYNVEEVVPAICGAFMCCNMKALEVFAGQIFDTSFFMYKEDIELSLRIRKNGWKLLYSPAIVAYHCRGWSKNRSSVSYAMRLCSAENEVKLYGKHPSFYLVWAVAKYVAVRLFRM